MHGGRQNCIAQVRFFGKQSKHWSCRYGTAITSCNQHLFHKDWFKQKKCPCFFHIKRKHKIKRENLKGPA